MAWSLIRMRWLSEIDRLAKQGVVVNAENLRIADNATLILSLHRELDGLREDAGVEFRHQDRHHAPRHRPGL